MHSDVGLFLVMAPAALLQADTLLPVAGSPPGAGLRLRLPGGEVVAPEVPRGSLLVMMGEAAERWMRLPPSLALHAPAHEVFVPQRPGVVRAWCVPPSLPYPLWYSPTPSASPCPPPPPPSLFLSCTPPSPSPPLPPPPFIPLSPVFPNPLHMFSSRCPLPPLPLCVPLPPTFPTPSIFFPRVAPLPPLILVLPELSRSQRPPFLGPFLCRYGRMFFPPKDAQLSAALTTGSDPGSESRGLTWGEYRAQTMDAFVRGAPEEASTAGCGPNTSKLGDEQTCGHGYVYCWMTCMSVAPTEGRCEPEEAVCIDTKGKLWPDEFWTPSGKPQHCFDCKVK